MMIRSLKDADEMFRVVPLMVVVFAWGLTIGLVICGASAWWIAGSLFGGALLLGWGDVRFRDWMHDHGIDTWTGGPLPRDDLNVE